MRAIVELKIKVFLENISFPATSSKNILNSSKFYCMLLKVLHQNNVKGRDGTFLLNIILGAKFIYFHIFLVSQRKIVCELRLGKQNYLGVKWLISYE